MRKTKTVRTKVSKNHTTRFEQLQQIKNLTKTFVAQFQQQKIIIIKHR